MQAVDVLESDGRSIELRRKIWWPRQRQAAASEADAAAIEAKVQFKFIILTIIFYYEFSLFKKKRNI